MVASALVSIGMTISLGKGYNPSIKLDNSNKLIPRLSQMLDGMRQEDPPMLKKHLVEADVPHFLGTLCQMANASPLDHVIRDLAIISFLLPAPNRGIHSKKFQTQH